MLEVYTAHYSTSDPDRLDITVKSATDEGKAFAPTWSMVWDFKTGAISVAEYTEMYHERMQKSYHKNKAVWEKLLARDRVVLVCFCQKGMFCHRLLLAKLLERLGAVYKGEL